MLYPHPCLWWSIPVTHVGLPIKNNQKSAKLVIKWVTVLIITYSILNCCIVSPQLWSGISCIQTGSLALRWWHTQYMQHGLLLSMASLLSSITICFCPIDSIWAEPLVGHIIRSFHNINHHVHMSWPWSVPPAHISVERRCGMQWKVRQSEF